MGRRRGNRGRQPQGFSGPEQRPVTDTLARGVGAKGRSKRHLFNQISGIMIMSAAVAGAFLGYTWLGCFGAVVGLIIAGGVISKLVVGRRYYR